MPLRMRKPQVRPAVFEPPPTVSVPSPAPSRRWRRGWFFFWAVCSACAIGGAYWLASRAQRHAKPAATFIRTAKAQSGRLEQTLRVTGMTAAENSALILAPRLSGSRHSHGRSDFDLVIQSIVDSGTAVKKGDVLAEFDRQYMLLRLDDYKDAVIQHENNIKVLYANLEVRRRAQEQKIRAAKGALDKALLNLKTAPVRSAIQTERFRLAAEEARSRYEEYVTQSKYLDLSDLAAIRYYELDYEVSKLEYKRAQANVEKMVVRAPIDGMVVIPSTPHGSEMRQIQQGDQVRSGETFMQVVDMRSMVVTASVNQADIDLLRLGQKARIRVDAFPDLELPGRVIAIGAYARSAGWRRSYVTSIPVRLKFEKSDPRLLPNFSVSADIVLNAKEGATFVPKECLFTENGGRKVVYIQKGAGWEKREVETGLDNNLVAEVVNGVREGEVLAAEPPPPGALAAGVD